MEQSCSVHRAWKAEQRNCGQGGSNRVKIQDYSEAHASVNHSDTPTSVLWNLLGSSQAIQADTMKLNRLGLADLSFFTKQRLPI